MDDFLSKIASDNENVEILDKLVVEEKSIKDAGMKTHIAYLDINSMYADCMTRPLPVGDYKWEHIGYPQQFIQKIQFTPDDAERGFILEVDLEYPKELHDLHSDLPLAPINKLVVPSPYTQRVSIQHDIKRSKVPKLLTTLENKEHYILHYTVLKYYLKLGLKVTNVHRCFSFTQSKWMEPFIKLNIKHRMEASKIGDEVKKGFFKLMNNSVYGKTMQNVRDYTLMRFTLSPKKAQRWFNQPDCDGVHIYNNHSDVEKPLVSCTFLKRKVKMNQPIVIGSTVLDHSKHMIYSIWYDKLKSKWGNNIQLLYQDTDSLVIKVDSPDFYKDLQDI